MSNKTNKEKAKLISEQFHCDDVAYDAAEQMAEWKDEQFQEEKKQMIERAQDFIATWFYEHPHEQKFICSDEFGSIDQLLEKLKNAMEE